MSTQKSPTISIIICTLQENGYIEHLLTDLQQQTLPPDEIIVVDGGSTDGSIEIIQRYPSITLLHSTPPVGQQRTHGGNHAHGDILIFLDADVRLQPTTIEKLAQHYTRKNVSLACPYYYPYQSKLWIGLFFLMVNGIFALVQFFAPSGAGVCMVMSKKTFTKHKGFDPQCTYDDIELIRRAGKQESFAMLPMLVHVSDRRFRKHGFLSMVLLYLKMSWYFARGDFKGANNLTYTFAEYEKKLH